MLEFLEGLVKVANETPLPNILVISGLFLIIISLIEKIGEFLRIPENSKLLALGMGVVLTTSGTFLWIKQSPDKGTPHAVSKKYYVQLVARSSKHEAVKISRAFRTEFSDLLEDLDTKIEIVDHPEHGAMYRVQYGTLSTEAKAENLCTSLIDSGANACLVVPK